METMYINSEAYQHLMSIKDLSLTLLFSFLLGIVLTKFLVSLSEGEDE